MIFQDRNDAGRRLAENLRDLAGPQTVVVGLPRGGVVVASEVSAAIEAPLDVLVVRKLGAPGQPELGIGAIAEDDVEVLNRDLIGMLGITKADLDTVRKAERAELERREARYRRGAPPLPVAGKTVLLIDDGLATGITAKAAARVLRARRAGRIVLAVPVGAPDTIHDLKREVDEVVCLEAPRWFRAVGQWYEDFRQTTDEQVIECLDSAARRAS
ncbi:putative phosphoribosyl transferase/MT0597 [bacterium BMS3Abin02]|nr:putative phosphoribosyl transferase/MT0597 [bacterium BMS3Abin02]